MFGRYGGAALEMLAHFFELVRLALGLARWDPICDGAPLHARRILEKVLEASLLWRVGGVGPAAFGQRPLGVALACR
eukprot:535517-Pleurochrysis_carterae.AAC.1